MGYKNIITDMDDTLLPCGRFYVAVQNEFGEFQAKRTGLPADVCINVFKGIDLACIGLPAAFNRDRFPGSFKAASYALDAISGITSDQEAAHKSWLIGDSVFAAPYDLFDGVARVLAAYREAGFRLFLLTKGDEEVQNIKIERNQLRSIFEQNEIYIVGKKNSDNVHRIIAEHNLNPAETISVGDSLRDDVGAALEAGIGAVYVHKNANKSWAYENTGNSHQPTFTVDFFTDLPTIIPYENAV